MTNIQEPVSVPVRQLVDEFGSHFSTSGHFSAESPYELAISEVFGEFDKYNHWDHLFETEMEAVNSVKSYFKTHADNAHKIYTNQTTGLIFKPLYLLTKIGLFPAFKKHLDNYAESAKFNSDCAENLPADFPITYLNGYTNVPKYMPKKGVDYYYLNVSNNDISIERVQVVETKAYSMNFTNAADYTFMFSFYFSGVDNDGVGVSLDFERLVNFDGDKWATPIHMAYLFVDEDKAKEFAVQMSEQSIASLQAKIEKLKIKKEQFS